MIATPSTTLAAEERGVTRGQASWGLVEFARNPYVSLVYMFVFAPYFASTVVGDPVRGQELWSFSYTISGICIAVVAPILGAVLDRLGRRKPWVIGAAFVMAPACMSLWFAMPATQGGLPLFAICALVIVLMVAFECGSVAHNAMLPSIATGPQLGRISGLGLASGATGSLIAQLIVLFGIVFPASHEVTWAFLPEHPLFGLDARTYEHARVVGPIAGLWLLVFIIPFMLWTPDLAATGICARRAVREGFTQLLTTVRHARQVSNVSVFLLARMLYNDGMLAIQAYCGIYAVGVFGWSLATIMLFAFILSAFCILGGMIAGWLDGRLSSRGAILASLVCTVFAVIVAISVTPNEVFFIPYDAAAAGPVWSLPYFRTLPELVYLGSYIVLAISITALIASSRALMARIAPVAMMTQFFGLYALSGTATTFLGHGMVALFTGLFHSQRVGLGSLLILMLAGWALLLKVREQRAPDLAIA